ncbi:response regulator [bacterium]|nr:response regulator [bacterium]
MDEHSTGVLLIEDNSGDARLIEVMLNEVHSIPLRFVRASRLAEGMQRLDEGDIDIVLLDLGLPDSGGLDTVKRAHAHAPDTPIIVLTGHDDEVLGVSSVWMGAQDYLVKGQVDSTLLGRAIRYALGRQRLQTEARRASFIDEATGLYNLRGFLTLADQHVRLAQRKETALLILAVRVDGLADMGTATSRQEANQVLLRVGSALRDTFRGSDVVAALEPGEFAALAIGAGSEHADRIIGRLHQAVESSEKECPSHHTLGICAGVVSPKRGAKHSAEQLLALAQKRLTRI